MDNWNVFGEWAREFMDLTGFWILLLVLLTTCLLVYTTWNTFKGRNLPLAGRNLPLAGRYLPLAGFYPLPVFSQKYGPVYTLYFGSNPVIILCGYQAVKEALVDQGEDFGGRGKLPTIDQFMKGQGVAFSNGETWRQLRRFSLSTLRNFGMGKKSIEERIQEEVGYLVSELRSYKEKPVDPHHILVQSVSNVICSIVFGNRFEFDDACFRDLLGMFAATFKDMSSSWGQLQDMLPNIMNHVPGPHLRINKHLDNLSKFIEERVKKNQETLDPDSPRDYIDCFLIKIQKEKQNPTNSFDLTNLVMTVLSLFFAGTETISTTLRHAFLILIHYPEIQAKLYEEIRRVIGENRRPNIEDRSKMPYTEAVIHEIQRFIDVIPMNVPHLATRDTTFRGYNIPKGIDVYPILYSVHRDPEQFATPLKFNPGHFLDDDGSFKKNEAFMPFSIGKRICLGEGLARMELFLFLTTILQNFTLTSHMKFTDDDIAPKMCGFANFPIPYQLSFIPR